MATLKTDQRFKRRYVLRSAVLLVPPLVAFVFLWRDRGRSGLQWWPAAGTVSISLAFRADGSSHDDIVVRVGAYECVCDSYYFAIDEGLEPRPGVAIESDGHARAVLIRLLGQWVDVLSRMGDGDTVFLPFDYSDQFTRCMRVSRRGDRVDVQVGTSLREGWSTSPSDIGDYVRSVTDFAPVESAEPQRSTVEELRSDLAQSMRGIEDAP